jgi:hypothetical protein
MIDLKISDGKNEAITSFYISVQRMDSQLPVLKSSHSIRVKELNRKQLTANEITITDRDTPSEQLKVIITSPPEYGTIERLIDESLSEKLHKKIEDKLISINTNTNQKLNFILKFGNFTKSSMGQKERAAQFVIVNEFTMSDLAAGLVYYNHRSPGIKQDRFAFSVSDGSNTMFVLEKTGLQTSASQLFHIVIDTDKNQAPVVEKNLGLDYLYLMGGN